MSTTVAIRFLAGRYHATPWGSHVNEADIEWPPAPWRLLRALIAVWHRKVGPGEISELTLRELVSALCNEQPEYRLPPASSGHARHYMPEPKGRGETTTLVFDGFLALDRDSELIVRWPSLALDDPLKNALSLLLSRLGYLGRAESWVEAALVDVWEGEPNCVPVARSEEVPGEALISVLVPQDPDAYRAWRTEEVGNLGLDQGRLRAREKRLLATLPDELFDALKLETGQVRGQGWSRHPGSAEAPYRWRPSRTSDRRIAAVTSHPIDTIRFGLVGQPLPRIEDAIKIGEIVRLAMIQATDRASQDEAVPSVVTGHGMGTDNVHGHAFYLPEDADGDGRIDHVIVHAEAGLKHPILDGATRLTKIWLDQGSEWGVVLDAFGLREEFPDHAFLGQGSVWVSTTPYLHPWYRKPRFGIEEQILKECRIRDLPKARLEQLPTLKIRGRERRPIHFHRFRSRSPRRTQQPDTSGSFWRLHFPVPVSGPIALGTYCHFGLGVFRRER